MSRRRHIQPGISIDWRAVLWLIMGLYIGPSLATPGEKPDLRFPPGVQWLNVERPLTAGDLRGKVVILDFWTYGCINCLHVAEELRSLEEAFGNRLAVIGVHTPKFDNEKNLETLRNTVVRWNLTHPVVNDPDWDLAKRYGMRAWPTLAVFTPEGRLLGKVTGEGNREKLERAISGLLDLYAKDLDDRPLPVSLEKARFASRLLAAPGKIAVSADGKRVAVSDTLHHRILLARDDGTVEKVFGGAEQGFKDGSAESARFNAPQGLAFGAEGLFVADAGNHAIRMIDFDADQVSTLAGTGRIGRGPPAFSGTANQDLRSPWAVAVQKASLFIAMAGSHQIWRMDLRDGRLSPYAGSRREGIDEGERRQASFSQPSGLALYGDDLYVADAEASAIRRIRLEAGTVENLVGTGLFDFGDRDGDFDEAALQHVSGIAALSRDKLVIADTYNHKVKLVDLSARLVTTLLGTGRPGERLGGTDHTELNEPGGVAVLGGQVLVADTNNHRILRLDPNRNTVEIWAMRLPAD